MLGSGTMRTLIAQFWFVRRGWGTIGRSFDFQPALSVVCCLDSPMFNPTLLMPISAISAPQTRIDHTVFRPFFMSATYAAG
jgi:hypothetical protein